MRNLYATIAICCLAACSMAAQTFCNPECISIPAGAPSTTKGPASPYPSTINVSGCSGTIHDLKVSLKGLEHTNPHDIDILLVGPTGINLRIMSDTGGPHDVSGIDLEFSDDAAQRLHAGQPLVSGTYKPTNYNFGNDRFPEPAPEPSKNRALSVFDGSDPNGTWSLYVLDDHHKHVGAIKGGWCISFECDEGAPEMDVYRGDCLICDGGVDEAFCAPCGQEETLTYTIKNSGTATLTLNVPVAAPGNQMNVSASIIQQPAASIPAGGSTTMKVQYMSLASGPFSFTLSIGNNDADENPYNWTVRGVCDGFPEMDVYREHDPIADGGTDTVECPGPCVPATITYAIFNTGDGDLLLNLPVVIGSQMNVSAVVTDQPDAVVQPGESTTFDVTYTPQATGSFSFTISIGNNDADENPYNWCVVGECEGEPEIKVCRGHEIPDGGTDEVDCPEPCSAGATLTYTIFNEGESDLLLDLPVVIGSQMNVVAVVTDQPDATVAAGGSTTFDVLYTPQGAGPFSFTISIGNNDENENPYNWSVQGECEGEPEITVCRGGHEIPDGGTDEVDCPEPCSAGATLTYTIKNEGDGDLLLDLPVVIGSQMNVVAVVTDQPDATVTAGGSTTFDVLYTPQGAGPFSFTISIGNNDENENPYNWSVRGECEGEPEMDVYRGDMEIPDGGTDMISDCEPCVEATLTYRIENNGDGDLLLDLPATISSQMNVLASIFTQPAAMVAPGGFTNMVVKYTPLTSGPFSFQISVGNNDENENPYNWCVMGDCEGEPEMDVKRGQTPVADGSVDEADCPEPCEAGDTLRYTIKNTGTEDLQLNLPVVIGSQTNVIASVTDQPDATVEPGESTTFDVHYTPQGAGAFSFTISIGNNDANENPYNWTVRGECEGEPEMDVFRGASAIADGGTDTVTDCEMCVEKQLTYTIRNTGDANLLLNVPVAAPGSQSNVSASIASQPAASVAPGGSTTMVVNYTPMSDGPFSFTISIGNNDANENPYNWTVQGDCPDVTAPEMDVFRGASAIADGGTDTVTDCEMCVEKQLTYTIRNTGTAPLLLNVPVAAPGSQNNVTASIHTQPAASVAPGGSTTMVVNYTPMSDGPFSFTISIGNNDANENPYNWTVQGDCPDVTAPEMDVFRGASAIADGGTDTVTDCEMCVQKQLTYTIRNTGDANLLLNVPVAAPGSQTNVSASIATQPAASVAPGGSTTMVVNYTPMNDDPFSFTISIGNNDANENPYNWTVQGDCPDQAAPEMDVFRNGTAIADGGTDTVTDCEMCVEKQLTYTIRNTGDAPLHLNVPVAAPGSLSNVSASIAGQPSATVAPGGSTTMNVNYMPLNDSPFSFTLSIGNDDANENPYNWTVQGDCPNPGQAPEMALSRQSLAIADGGSDALGTQSLGAHTVTYRITNTGDAALNLNGSPALVALTAGSNVSGLSVTSQPASSIAAGGFTEFTVAYTVDAEGPFSFNVSIANNDSDENPYNFTVSGNGSETAAADIAVRRGDYELADGGVDGLGSVEAGTEIVLSYEISNVGDANLAIDLPVNVSATSNVSVAVSLQPSANIAAGGSSTLVITLTALAEGPFAAEVRIDSNDPDEDPFSWTISGTAMPDSGNGGGIDVGVDDVTVNCGAGEASTGLWMLFIMVSASLLAARALRLRR